MKALIPKTLTEKDNAFPDVSLALKDPNGLLAMGGDLSIERLLEAYKHGIFPWYDENQPILWWSPDPRAVLFFDKIKISRSLQKSLKKNFTITFNTAFTEVVKACAKPRVESPGTWIHPQMMDAYEKLFDLGHAMSAEVWQDEKLVGGLYGVVVNKIFSGESMFHIATDASKIALVHLAEHLKEKGFKCIDCQIINPFLESMGTEEITRERFLKLLKKG